MNPRLLWMALVGGMVFGNGSVIASTPLERLFQIVTLAGNAMETFAKGIEQAYDTGAKIYDDLDERAEKTRLLDLSARLSHLGMIQKGFVGTLEEFTERPELEQWEELHSDAQIISLQVRDFLAELKAERSPLVSEGQAYDALLQAMKEREEVLGEFRQLDPPLTNEDLGELQKIQDQYSIMIKNLYHAKDALNQYIAKRFKNPH